MAFSGQLQHKRMPGMAKSPELVLLYPSRSPGTVKVPPVRLTAPKIGASSEHGLSQTRQVRGDDATEGGDQVPGSLDFALLPLLSQAAPMTRKECP